MAVDEPDRDAGDGPYSTVVREARLATVLADVRIRLASLAAQV
jgi:hypothetical protein